MNCKVMRAGRQHRGVCEGNVPSQFAILCARTPLNPTQTHHHSPSLSTLHTPWFACILLSANPYLQILFLSKFCIFGLKLCLRFTFFSWIQLAQIFFHFVNIQDFWLPECFQSKKLHFVQSQLAILSPRTPLPTARLCTLQHSPSIQVLSGLFIFLSSRLQSSVLRQPIVPLYSSHPSLHPHLHLSPSFQFSKSLSIFFFSSAVPLLAGKFKDLG